MASLAADPRVRYVPAGQAADTLGCREVDLLGEPGAVAVVRVGDTPDCADGIAVARLVDPSTGRPSVTVPATGILSYVGPRRYICADGLGVLLRP